MPIPRLSWPDFKAQVDAKGLARTIQWIDIDDAYHMQVFSGPFKLECKLNKDEPASADQTDFETNYKDASNKPPVTRTLTQTAEVPVSIRIEGDTWSCPADTETTYFMPLNNDYRMRGAEFQVVNGKAGDTVEVWVTDKDGIVYPAGTKLTKYVPKFCVYEHISGTQPVVVDLVDEDTSDVVPQIFYLEFKYTNNQTAGSDDVQFIINFWMYEEGQT